MGYDGPAAAGTITATGWPTDPPAFRVWDGSTRVALIKFNAANCCIYSDRTMWIAADPAPATVTEARNRKVHPPIGYWLSLTVQFRISKSPPQDPQGIDGFTRASLALLRNARISGYDIEFYPHASLVPSSKDSRYVVEIVSDPGAAPNNALMSEHTMTLLGTTLVTAIPSDL